MLRTMDFPTSNIQRIWKAGALALGGIVAANLLIRAVAYAAFDVPNAFPLLHVGPAMIWTALLVVALVAIRGRLERRSQTGGAAFLAVAIAVLALLLCIDVMLMIVPVLPGTVSSSILTLILMQAASTGLSVYFLGAP